MSDPAAARTPDDSERRALVRPSRELFPPRKPLPLAARREGVILIVDDFHDARELYATYLSHAGFSVFTARDGMAAVNIALQVRPDVIVMDLSMPHLDGISATQRIRQDPQTRHIPVILLTGYPQRAIERGALEAGVDVFLTKPCLPEDLETQIRQVNQPRGSS